MNTIRMQYRQDAHDIDILRAGIGAVILTVLLTALQAPVVGVTLADSSDRPVQFVGNEGSCCTDDSDCNGAGTCESRQNPNCAKVCVCPDSDGDGYDDSSCVSSGGDCDDSDASIHPDATDDCDGVEEDCDSSTDEDASCGTGYTCTSGSCTSTCGDGTCASDEQGSCAQDCDYCGDGTCQSDETESSCPQDCDNIAPQVYREDVDVGADEIRVSFNLDDASSISGCEVRDGSGSMIADCLNNWSQYVVYYDWDSERRTLLIPIDDSWPGIMDVKVWAEDGQGNTRTTSIETVRFSDKIIKQFRVTGDPRHKINMLVYGHDLTTAETTQALRKHLQFFYNRHNLSFVGRYGGYFNWYYVDVNRNLCDQLLGFDEPRNAQSLWEDSCPKGREQMRSWIGSSSKIKNGQTGLVILSPRDKRSYAFSGPGTGWSVVFNKTGSRGDDWVPYKPRATFAHEMGHLVWGFDDEYGGDNHIREVWPTLFYNEDAGATVFRNISNTWRKEGDCTGNLSGHSQPLDRNDCYKETRADTPGWVIQEANSGILPGISLWRNSTQKEPRLFEVHRRRIQKLMEENTHLYRLN